MIKLYLQSQDEKNILIADQFFEVLHDKDLPHELSKEDSMNEIKCNFLFVNYGDSQQKYV